MRAITKGSGLLICTSLLFILSCGDSNRISDIDTRDPTISTRTITITYLLPIFDSLIQIDSISALSGTVLSWDTTGGSGWYRVYVYDSLDATQPISTIQTNKNSYSFTKYEAGHTFLFQVFHMGNRILVDRDILPNDTLMDSIQVSTPYGNLCFSGDFVARSFPDSPYVVVDSSPGYYICIDTTNPFSIQVRTTVSDTVIVVIPDNYTPQFKVRYYNYASPVISAISYLSSDSLIISWQKVAGDSVTGYRIYLRDYTGIAQDSLDVDTAVTSVVFTGNAVSTVQDTQVVLSTIQNNTAYKINIATLSAIGPGSIDSSYAVDTSDTGSTRLTLPYAYYSTYAAPDTGTLDNLAGIKGGIYLMGDIWESANGSLCQGARPAHEVIVSSFYMSACEVTCSSYAVFLNAIRDSITYDSIYPSHMTFTRVTLADTAQTTWYISCDSSGIYTPEAGKETCPVLGLFWHGAAAYCNWLSEQDSTLENCYDASWQCDYNRNGYRLPTEAQFEYAASGAFYGNKQRFPWGYAFDPTKASVNSDSVKAVGSYGPYHGFCDLVGNAMEYVNDWRDELTGLFLDSSSYYVSCRQQGVVIDPTGPPQKPGYTHIMRGGSYVSDASACVTCYRTIHASERLYDYGFRVVRCAQ